MSQEEMLRRLMHRLFRREMARKGIDYYDTAKQIGYSVAAVRAYMSKLRRGKRGSRFVEHEMLRYLICRKGADTP